MEAGQHNANFVPIFGKISNNTFLFQNKQFDPADKLPLCWCVLKNIFCKKLRSHCRYLGKWMLFVPGTIYSCQRNITLPAVNLPNKIRTRCLIIHPSPLGVFARIKCCKPLSCSLIGRFYATQNVRAAL